MTVSDEMTCEQFTEMAPAYALAVLDETERTACTRHLAQSGPHRGCREAVGEARQVIVRLADTVPARPPSPGLWRAIEARLADAPTGAVGRRRRLRVARSGHDTEPLTSRRPAG
jgi:anti-sigma-K factor RskA